MEPVVLNYATDQGLPLLKLRLGIFNFIFLLLILADALFIYSIADTWYRIAKSQPGEPPYLVELVPIYGVMPVFALACFGALLGWLLFPNGKIQNLRLTNTLRRKRWIIALHVLFTPLICAFSVSSMGLSAGVALIRLFIQ